MARVLVTDAEQRAALAVVRSLGAAGHHVITCSSAPRPLAGASRYCRAEHVVVGPKTSVEAYLAGVLRIVDGERIEVVLPVTDLSAVIVPTLRERRPGVAIAFPDFAAYERISDKRHLMDVAQGLGVPVPRQVVLERVGDTLSMESAAATGLTFPLVIKPSRSAVIGAASVSSFGVRMVGSERELASALSGFSQEAYPLLVQEQIQGPGLGAFMLAERGKVLAAFAHRRIREKPPTGGVSVYRESVPLREDLRRYSEHILEHFGWSGVAMVEFKEDATSGTPYLMEVNGRFWGSLQLAIDAGVDFPDMLIRSVLGKDVAVAMSYRTRVRSRWLWGDVDHLIGVLRAPRSVREAHPELPSRARAVARFLIPWRPGDRYEVLRLRDPMPFVRESLQWIQGVLRR